jgi:hypothetical protein
MGAPDILRAIAACPDVAPAFASSISPAGFGRWDNWVVFNRFGQRWTVVFAQSEEQALRIARAPAGYFARIERYGCPAAARLARPA